jgi:hypothetical protein
MTNGNRIESGPTRDAAAAIKATPLRGRDRQRARKRDRSPASQQLIRVDVDSHSDVFGEGQFVQGFTHKPA